jgi:hypothetical protein
MHTRGSALNDVGWIEWWKVLEPEAGCFGFAVSKLPRLDYLVVFRTNDFKGVTVRNGIFSDDPLDWRAKKRLE